MRQNAAKNITPPNGWRFSALSITPEHGEAPFHNPFGTDTVYLGSRALEAGVEKVLLSIPEADRFVEVLPFPSQIVRGMHDDILAQTKELIREQILQAQKENRDLILSFSAWSGQQSLDIMDLVDYARKASNDRAVCIVGGPVFSTRNPELEADFFAAGADLINIGGGEQIANYIARLTKNDRFYRDANGNLIAHIPEGMPFFSSSPEGQDIISGGDLPVPVYYDPSTNTIYVSLAGSGCGNRCDFCSVAAALVRPQLPESDSEIAEIAEQVKDIARQVTQMYAKAGWDVTENPVCLNIVNPNPTQGQGFERLKKLLSDIFFDMTEPMKVLYFLDTSSFRKTENMEQQLAFIDELLTKNKNIEIQPNISLDAYQAENDGDFMGRRIGGRLIREDEYDAIRGNCHRLIEEISGKEWASRVHILLSQIVHPATTPDVYKQKLALKNNPMIFRGSPEYLLMPYTGTPISQKYQSHFVPMDYMEKDWELGHVLPSDNLSYWGNQFKNGDLLDCITFYRLMSNLMKDDLPLVVSEAVLAGWDDGKAKLFTHPFEEIEKGDELEKGCIVRAQAVLNTKPRIIGVIKPFVNLICAKKTKESDVEGIALTTNAYVHWIIRRERYLAKVNPEYANNPNCQYLIKTAEEMREKLLSSPYANKFDLRPPRSLSLKDKKAVPRLPNL